MKQMCAQLEVLKKIRKKGKVNGYDVDLAEAQAKDYMTMKTRLDNIESDVSAIKTEQAVQSGKLDLIIQRLNSPVEEERKNGIIWAELKGIMKTPMGKIIVILAIGCIGLAGQRILELLGLIH